MTEATVPQTEMEVVTPPVDENRPPEDLVQTVEALLFAAHEPMTPSTLAPALNGTAAATLDRVMYEINRRLEDGSHPMRVRKVAGGYQMHVLPEFGPAIEAALVKTKTQRLSRAGLETLAIIAYKQPCSTPEIEQIRGVSCGGVLSTLMERNLVAIVGRSDGPGRPLQYGTTREFLNYFGLNNLKDLPSAEEIEELLAQKAPREARLLKLISEDSDDEVDAPHRLVLPHAAESAGPTARFKISDVRFEQDHGGASAWANESEEDETIEIVEEFEDDEI